jgi:hypothetical protein
VFKLIMTDPKAREEIIKDYNELKSKAG